MQVFTKIYANALKTRIAKLVERSEVLLNEETKKSLLQVGDAYENFKNSSDDFTRFAFSFAGITSEAHLPPPHNRLVPICLGVTTASIAGSNFLIPHTIHFPKNGINFSYYQEWQRSTAQEMALDAALSSLAATTIEKIQIRCVSYIDFGECFSPLALFPNRNLSRFATDDEKLSVLLDEIEQRLLEARAIRVRSSSSEPAHEAKEADYLIILIDLDSEFSEQVMNRLKKFLNSEACARSGIHFISFGKVEKFIPTTPPEIAVHLGENFEIGISYSIKSTDLRIKREKALINDALSFEGN